MRIAGIYPQKIELDPKIQHAVSEPYGLEKVLAVAKEDGYKVELFLPVEEKNGNFFNLDEEKFIKRIVKFRPDILCISLYTCQYPMGVRIAAKLKEIIPNIIVIGGNRYPTFLKEKIHQPFDFFVVGEGEATFRELLHEIKGNKNFERVKGIAFQKNGKGIYTGPRERIQDLDSFPDALRHEVITKQVYRGISIPPISKNPNYAVVEYSRGCYGVCKFCDNKHVWGSRITFRSPNRVVDELERLKSMGIDIFYFMDLNFTAVPKKAMELCDAMLRRNLDIAWYCMSNIATANNNKLLQKMKQAGCYKIAWGIESTNDCSLEKMDKRIGAILLKQGQAKTVLQKALETGFLNQGYYIIGFPWETEESIIRDAKKLQNLPLHQLNVGLFTPIPLSDFHYEVSSKDLDPDLEKHDRNTLIYKHQTLTHDILKRVQTRIHSNFYSDPRFLQRVKKSVSIDNRFDAAFNEYFKFLG